MPKSLQWFFFFAFNKQKLIRFAQLYPHEFSNADLMALDNHLKTYTMDMRTTKDFRNLKRVSKLAKKPVETKQGLVYMVIYLLLQSAMEKAFSAIKIVKNQLHN